MGPCGVKVELTAWTETGQNDPLKENWGAATRRGNGSLGSRQTASAFV